jgi:hypothetical protein
MENEKLTAPSVAPLPEKTKGFLNNLFTLDGLPKVFQIILGVSSLFYVTGYLCWAIYAWRNKLGFLPALREQYFSAGFFPLFLVGLIWVTLKGHYRFSEWFSSKVTVNFNSKIYIGLLVSAVLAVLIGFILFILNAFKFICLSINELYALDILVFIIGYPYVILRRRGFVETIKSIYFPTAVVILYLFVIYYYVIFLFQEMPRELGGPREVKVRIDIKRSNISLETLSTLLAKGVNDTSSVIRTKPIYLIFDEGDFILFKQNLARTDSTNGLLKIRKEAIMGMYDCYDLRK